MQKGERGGEKMFNGKLRSVIVLLIFIPVSYCFSESYVTYCIVGIVILVIIGVIIGIIYFLIQHPKFARAMYKAIEADATNESADPMKKITTITNQLGRITNKTSTMTFDPSKVRGDDD